MPVLGTVDVNVKVRVDQFNRDIDKSENKFKKFGKSVDKVANRIAKSVLGLTVATAAISTAVIKVGLDFEREMTTVGAVSRATVEEFKQLEAAAREAGATTEWSATQSAEALKYMAMAGFNAQQAISALPDVLNLATAGQLDLGRASDIATDTLTAMGLKVSDLSRLNDVFIGTTTRANTDVNMLGESFKYVAPIAGQLNYSLEETSSMLGILANAGIKASDAGTDLRQAMLRTEKAVKALGMGEGSNLIDVLKEIEKRQLSVNQVTDLFGIIATKSVLVLKKNIKEHEKFTKTLRTNQGEHKKIADSMRDTLGGALKTLKSSMEENALKLFDIMKDDLRDIVEWAIKGSRAFGEWIEKNEDLLNSKIPEYLTSIKESVKDIWDFIQSHPDMIKYGLVGMMMGPGSAVLLGSFGHLLGVFKNIATAIDEVKKGNLEFSEFAFSNAEELAEKLKTISSTSELDRDILKTKKIIADLKKEIDESSGTLLASVFGGSDVEKMNAELGQYQGKLISLNAFKAQKELKAQEELAKKEKERIDKLNAETGKKKQIELEIKNKDEIVKAIQEMVKVDLKLDDIVLGIEKNYGGKKSDELLSLIRAEQIRQADLLMVNRMKEDPEEEARLKRLEPFFKILENIDLDKAHSDLKKDSDDIKKPEETLYQAAMEFKWGVENVIQMLEEIVNIPSAIIDAYASLFDTAGNFSDKLFDSIINLDEAFAKMFEGIPKIFTELLPEIPRMVSQILSQFIYGLPEIWKAFFDGIPKFVDALSAELPDLILTVISQVLTWVTGGGFGGLVDFGEIFGIERPETIAETMALKAALEGAANSAQSLIDDIKQWQRDIAYEKSDDKVGFLKDELSDLAEDIARETDSQKRIEIMEKQWQTTKDLYDVAKEQLENLKESESTVQNALDSLTLKGNTTSLASAGDRYNELFEAAKTGDSSDVSTFVSYQEQYRSFLEASGASSELMREKSINDLTTLKGIIEERKGEFQTLQQAIEENTQGTNINSVGLDSVVKELQSINSQIGNLGSGGSSSSGGFLGSVLGNVINPFGKGNVFGGLFAEGGYADTASIFGEAGGEWAIPDANSNNSRNGNFLKSVGYDQVLELIGKGFSNLKVNGNSKGGDITVTIPVYLNGKVVAREVVKVAQSDAQTKAGLKRAVA
ncbi:MAG: phage tail tape measure protein [Deltaproteobacteria bacterium]|nr:phage tail tape measure protein [Deltaproteobacteria bacterium]